MKRMHTFRLCTLFYISVILLQLICPAKAINSEDFSLIAGEETDGITSAKNISLEELQKTWMAKMGGDCIFISAKQRTNIDIFKQMLYDKVRYLHVQKYPYNDFLYQKYE